MSESALGPPGRALPLDALHRELGARMGPFAGFQMPIQYPTGLRSEHLHTRSAAGLFDVSHMGQLRLRARDGSVEQLARELERALPVELTGWPVGQQRYSVLLNDAGGIEDDLMMVRWQGADTTAEIRMVVNASNRAADLARLRALCPGLIIEELDAALIALQGPAAEAVLGALDARARALRFMQAAELSLLGAPCLATRSGYTGEDGFEISVPLDVAEALARRLLAHASVQPVGLGARDTLRLEAGLPLHGQDIDTGSSPIEAGLNFAIARSRRTDGPKAGGFPGASRVLAELAGGTTRQLAGFISREGVPVRSHAELVDSTERVVGAVTSGTISPSLGCAVMLARIERSALQAGAVLRAVVRDRRPELEHVPLPFVPKRYRR